MKTEKVSSTTSFESKSQKGTHPYPKRLPQMGSSCNNHQRPQAKYGRTVNVLDALAVVGIGNATFTVSDEEQ
jgi:hypothetical protein